MIIIGLIHGFEAFDRKLNLPWINNALVASEFSFDNLRMPSGNYVWDLQNKISTSCWDNFSQFSALMAFGTQQILEFQNQDLGMAAITVAEQILAWQQKHFWNPLPPGGFYAYSYSNGSNLDTDVQYSDDNCLAGVILLEVHASLLLLNASGSPVQGNPLITALLQNTLQQAQLCAEWAITSPAWAGIVGGGFWWNVSVIDIISY